MSVKSTVIITMTLVSLLFWGCKSSSLEKEESSDVSVGDQAPDFDLPNQEGKRVSLKNYLGKEVVVLYFYPKDNTSVCTKQACQFRDQYEVFRDAGAEVIGISSDSVSSHRQFVSQYGLPFDILSDEDGKVRDRYGATSFLGIPGRVTYVIDMQGKVRLVFEAMFDSEVHIEEALRMVNQLKG